MIQNIQLLRNIGVFDSFTGTAQTAFKKLTLIYGENGRGKTTLSAIFRSLESSGPIPITERKRFTAGNDPHVVIECDGGTSPAVFQNNSWSRAYPNIRIFDDTFVDENVHSGLEVSSEHRQNLHQLIIGRQGVTLARQVEDLTTEIAQFQSELRNRASAITADVRGPFSVDDFCALTPRADIETAIAQAEQRVAALQQAEAVRTTQPFEPFEPPTLDIEAIRNLLRRELSHINAAAARTVQAHFQQLGDQAEVWVSQGMEFLGDAARPSQSCPFCNQSLAASDLIGHYRSYFSEAYTQHKAAITSQIGELNRVLGEDAFVRFNRLITQQSERHHFWSRLTGLIPFSLDMERMTNAWQNLRNHLARLLGRKQQTPLEAISIDDEVAQAIREYEALRDGSRTLSRSLFQANEAIRKLKEEAAAGSLAAASNDLAQLRAIRARFTGTVSSLCNAYLDTRTRKDVAEAQKIQAREALDQYRETVFPRYQRDINEYLRKFNARFRIVEVQAVNPRGAPSSTYQIEIDNRRVQLAQQNPGEPAFKNTLSAGDRNTLALAFFFASLDQEPALASVVVLIDDPVSSLDDGRTITTAQEIRALTQRADQVILLSHARRALCAVWQNADHQNCCALAVIPAGTASTIDTWNVREEAITEYDRLHELLRNYVGGTERDIRKVAQSLRHVLEGYLRVVCTEHCSPGTLIGRQFIPHARELARRGQPILSDTAIGELESIVEYANRFHHETNPNWDVAVNNINEQELSGFVRRTLDFTRK